MVMPRVEYESIPLSVSTSNPMGDPPKNSQREIFTPPYRSPEKRDAGIYPLLFTSWIPVFYRICLFWERLEARLSHPAGDHVG